MDKTYDLIIIGAGPAGLTAAIYAGRYILDTLIFGEVQGGTITEAHKICNFPSEKEILGMRLASKMLDHVQTLGINPKTEKIEKVSKQNNIFKVKTNKKEYKTKKIILAVGREKQKLGVKGEEKFLGKGVSYCAICDAAFFKNKIVVVIGGSNAALTAALLLSEYAKKVYIVYRREKFFRAEPTWIKQVEEDKKIEILFNANIKEICGKEKIEKVELDSGDDLEVEGVFIEIGYVPNEKFSKQFGLKTEEGYIKVNKKQETNIGGVFAAGDITNNPLKQVITACGEGAIAANSAYEEIKSEKNKR